VSSAKPGPWYGSGRDALTLRASLLPVGDGRAHRGVETGRRFRGRWALRGVSVAVRPGETHALIGPNGAGKTTLLGLLAGAAEPDEGRVSGAGGRSGFVPQRAALYRRLTARENLELFARLEGLEDPATEARRLLAASDLEAVADRPCGTLSVGQLQRVNVAVGLLGTPQVVLLDEPTAALDPRQRLLLWDLLAAVRARAGAVVFTTQNLEEVVHADRLLILHEGRCAFRARSRSSRAERASATTATSAPSCASSTTTAATVRHEGAGHAPGQGPPRAAPVARDPARAGGLPRPAGRAGGHRGAGGRERPRVALVDQADLPTGSASARRRSTSGSCSTTCAGASTSWSSTRRTRGRPRRRARRGHGDGPGRVRARRAERPALARDRPHHRDGAIAERAARETQALVFALNTAFQRELLRQNVEYLGLLVTGGETRVLGRDVDILGLDRTAALVEEQIAATDDPAERERLGAILDFARDARTALGIADASLEATARPIVLAERRVGGAGALLANRAAAIVLAVGLTLVGVLLGAGAVAGEREENVVGRLLRGPVRRSVLILEKVVLVALVAVVVGLVLAGAYVVAGALSGLEAPQAVRLVPLLGVLLPAGCAIGAVGVLIGVLVRDLAGGALVALLLTLPFVLAGIVPRGVVAALDVVSAAFPFAATVEALTGVLYDADPVAALATGAAHLGALAVLYGGAARLLSHRLGG
jgi:ABC-type multidrug transport system ATPase subunit